MESYCITINIQNVFCSLIRKVSLNVKHIVTVAEIAHHCVVLQLKLDLDNMTIVYDGRDDKNRGDINKWKEHEERIMERCGIKKDATGPKWMMRYGKPTSDFQRIIHYNQNVTVIVVRLRVGFCGNYCIPGSRIGKVIHQKHDWGHCDCPMMLRNGGEFVSGR